MDDSTEAVFGLDEIGHIAVPVTDVERAGEGSVLYYRVPDLQAAFRTLSERGVTFETEPHLIARLPDHELWMAFFRDPDRNLLALMSEIRP